MSDVDQNEVEVEEVEAFVGVHVGSPSVDIRETASHPAEGRVAMSYLSTT
jgi:hypothetical protein